MIQIIDERDAANKLCKIIQQNLPKKYKVETGRNVCYCAKIKGYSDNGLAIFEEASGKKYKYQTDICISKVEEDNSCNIYIPEIIIETKLKSYSSHDVITYSEKALAHKKLHPNLKYGFVVIEPEDNKLQSRFFAHNFGFDFAFLLNLNDESETEFFIKKIIRKLLNSNTLEKNQAIKGFVNFSETYPIKS